MKKPISTLRLTYVPFWNFFFYNVSNIYEKEREDSKWTLNQHHNK